MDRAMRLKFELEQYLPGFTHPHTPAAEFNCDILAPPCIAEMYIGYKKYKNVY